MQINFLCVCGHSKEIHDPINCKRLSYSPDSFLKTACYYEIKDGDSFCKCSDYKQDNLKYLEQLNKIKE